MNYQASNKRIAKNTILLYFRMLFSMGVSLYTSRITLNVLGINDFGIYNIVGGIVAMFTFMSTSLLVATQRFLNLAIGKSKYTDLQKIFNTSLGIHLLIALIILILGETIGLWFLYNKLVIPPDRFAAAVWTYQFSIISCILIVVSAPYNATIVAHEKMNVFAYISIFEVSAKLLIAYLLLLAINIDKLKLYSIMICAIQIVVCLIYIIYSKRQFIETRGKIIINRFYFKEIGHFVGWNMLGHLSNIINTQGLNILLNIFFGPSINAARGIAVQVQNAIMSFCSNFQVAINPQIMKSYANSDFSYMHKLIFASSKYSFFLLLFLSLPVFIETKIILSIWLKVVPNYTVSFIRLVLLISMVSCLANPIITSIHATGKIRNYQIVEAILLLSIAPISYFYLSQGSSPNIVFGIYLVIVTITQLFRIYLLCPTIKLSFREYLCNVIYPIIKVSLFSCFLPIIIFLLLTHSIATFIIVSCTSICSVFFFTYILGLNRSEKDILKKKIHAIINKK